MRVRGLRGNSLRPLRSYWEPETALKIVLKIHKFAVEKSSGDPLRNTANIFTTTEL